MFSHHARPYKKNGKRPHIVISKSHGWWSTVSWVVLLKCLFFDIEMKNRGKNKSNQMAILNSIAGIGSYTPPNSTSTVSGINRCTAKVISCQQSAIARTICVDLERNIEIFVNPGHCWIVCSVQCVTGWEDRTTFTQVENTEFEKNMLAILPASDLIVVAFFNCI